MRRGAPINSQPKRAIVMADMNDLEGGGGGGAPSYSGNTPPTSGSGSSYGLNNRDSVSYAPPPVYDSGKSPASKRRVINRVSIFTT